MNATESLTHTHKWRTIAYDRAHRATLCLCAVDGCRALQNLEWPEPPTKSVGRDDLPRPVPDNRTQLPFQVGVAA